MLGAIIGDIIGSRYEFNNVKTKDFPLFVHSNRNADGRHKSKPTDDTICTLAVAQKLMGDYPTYTAAFKDFCMKYPHAGYGAKFYKWLHSSDESPYGSFGNGSAMRVSPCGWVARFLDEAELLAEESAEATHNHPEGIKGAQAVASSICLARHGFYKPKIREHIEARFGYDLSKTVDEIREAYEHNEECQRTVPEAIICFLESSGYEDAIRNAISIGGDSDTLAAITGSIAEAAWGIPDPIREEALEFLDPACLSVVTRWSAYMLNHAVARLYPIYPDA